MVGYGPKIIKGAATKSAIDIMIAIIMSPFLIGGKSCFPVAMAKGKVAPKISYQMRGALTNRVKKAIIPKMINTMGTQNLILDLVSRDMFKYSFCRF